MTVGMPTTMKIAKNTIINVVTDELSSSASPDFEESLVTSFTIGLTSGMTGSSGSGYFIGSVGYGPIIGLSGSSGFGFGFGVGVILVFVVIGVAFGSLTGISRSVQLKSSPRL